jgi:hypothetical protein
MAMSRPRRPYARATTGHAAALPSPAMNCPPHRSSLADGFIMKESTMTKLLFALAFVLPLAVAAVAMMTLPS